MSEAGIAELLLAEISRFADRLKEQHPLMDAARRGRVRPVTVVSYLSGVKFLLEHTPIHLEAAANSAVAQGAPEVAAFFMHKEREEQGHARWADSDLGVMQQVFGVEPSGVPESMARMVGFIGEVARRTPLHYLGYILFAEHATVQAGATWVKALEEHCGIPLSALSSIAKHVELDQFHVVEARDEVNHLLREVCEPAPILSTLRGAMSHFEAFCDELALSVDLRSVRPPRDEQARYLAN